MLGTDFSTGSPDWLDLGSPDTEGAATFYGRVFGWDFATAGPDAGGYGFFQQDGKIVAALGPLTEKGAATAWNIYFNTPDADATVRTAEQGGGRVRVPARDVMEAGRTAALTDPGGADFALWQPRSMPGLERTSQKNTLVWIELHTADPESVLAFYGTLFGWRWQAMETPGMTYRVISTAEGDVQDASFGGAAPLQPGAEQARWIPYFMVEDPDRTAASVVESGGSVPMAPEDVPDVGRIAWFADPFGAPFAVLKPAV
ncbi:hydroxylase [Streptomyces laurentii]|uniref:Hydroxylase n=1 Tax=Streptomyces laurentii TaxID=39478 RepID=A0A160P819_STRLU|nr:hydroxylase [Streptomyces laurentii]